MTRGALAVCVVAVGLSAATPTAAWACSCIPMKPCEVLAPTGTSSVFEATVAAIEPAPVERLVVGEQTTITLGRVKVHLKDVRPLLGESSDVVFTSADGASCGYTFRIGERYVIDAGHGPNGLTTGSCSQTKPVAHAAQVLAYIGSLSKPSPGASISGTVTLMTMGGVLDEAQERQFTPPGIRVRLEGAATRSTTPLADGTFEFAGLPSGDYRVLADPATGPYLAPVAESFTLAHPHACRALHIALELDASLEGSVVDRDGRAIAGAHVAVRRPDGIDANGFGRYVMATTDSFGRYRFPNLPPGRYIAGLNIDSGPREDSHFLSAFVADPSGRPEVIDFPLGGHVELAPLVAVPPTDVVVRGRVVWPDGSAGAGLVVSASGQGEARFSVGTHHRTSTDTDGRFSVTLAEGVRYQIRAFPDPEHRRASDSGIEAEVELVATTQPLVLVLTRRR